MEKPNAKTKVLIVDDHPIVRQGLAQLLNSEPDFVVCGQAGSAREAMTAIAQLKPDMGIVDISLPGTDGLELIKSIVVQRPDLPLLVLSMHEESLYAERALHAGAKGYMMKQEATDKLTGALRRILHGQIYASEELAEQIMRKAIEGKSFQDASPVASLSDRELEVLQLMGQGHGTRQIADELHLSVKTIESHRANIKEKLRFKTAPEMMRFAVEWVGRNAL